MSAGPVQRDATPSSAETVVKLIRNYREGSTSPALVETGTGERFILKFAGAGPGPRALLIEFLATRLAGALGLRVPSVQKLFLPEKFPWQIGTDEFDDLVQRSAGWNLGVRFIPDARDLVEANLAALPKLFLARLGQVDRLLRNVDRTRRNPNLLRDDGGAIWAIDHGACLFLDRIVAGRTPYAFDLPANHFLATIPADAVEPANGIPADRITAWIEEAPDNWLASIPLSCAVLAERLSAYVDAFATTEAKSLRGGG